MIASLNNMLMLASALTLQRADLKRCRLSWGHRALYTGKQLRFVKRQSCQDTRHISAIRVPGSRA